MHWWLGVQMITVHRWFDADLVADDSSVRLWTNLIPSFSPGCCRELQVNVFEPQQYQSVFCVWRVRGVCESGLPLAYVPVQTLSQTFKPVIHQVVTTDRWHWITGGRDLNTVGRRTDGRIILKLRKKVFVVNLLQTSTLVLTSLRAGSPASSCHQTTPRQCSWHQGTTWSVSRKARTDCQC